MYAKNDQHSRVIQLRCRSWTCPKCRPRRQRRLRWQALSGNPVTFITLTVNPAIHSSPGDAARAVSKAWRAARRAIEAHYKGKKGEYLTVVEATQRGWPHLHVLTTRRWIDQRWLSALWDRLTGAPIVHIERVRHESRAAAYVAKYLGKAPHRFAGLKRYYFTRGYVKTTPRDAEPFDWSKATVEIFVGNAAAYVANLLASHYSAVIGRDGYWILAHPPPACVFPQAGSLGRA